MRSIFWTKPSCVIEVTFEANGPTAFDDVVVRYDPPVARSGADRVAVEYHQVKWHVEYGGRFGFDDFVDPAFIGAKTLSLLERLKAAKQSSANGSRFALITTYRVRDGDPLAKLDLCTKTHGQVVDNGTILEKFVPSCPNIHIRK